MKRMIFSMAAGLLLLATSPVQALQLPDGKAAIAEAVLGKVSANQGHGYKALKLGQALEAGSTLKTGSNGRVSLRLSDGSSARLAPNTELTLKDETVRKGFFTKLIKGTVRFLVAKQTAGRSFETEMPNAVAAVKGTDTEQSTDGKVSKAVVFSSGNPIALLFTDTKSGKDTSLKPGEKLVFDGAGFKVENVTEQDLKDSDKNYQGLPEPKEGEGKEGQGGGQGGGDQGNHQVDDAIGKATEEALQEATKDIYLDGFLERDVRTGDIAAGKIIYDRFGERVQVSHFITRQGDNGVTISSFSKRDGGPNVGVSSAIESATYNKALPDNWGAVFTRKLGDSANLDGNGYPVYFRQSENFLASNPMGDAVKVDTTYDAPDWKGVHGGPLEQGFNVNLYVNGQFQVNVYAGDSSALTNNNVSLFGINNNIGGSNGSPWNNTANANGNTWSFNFNYYSQVAGASVLTREITLLDDHGNVLQNPNGTLTLPKQFQGLNANVEVAFKSALFQGRSIDVLFLPGFFDLYDMLNTGTILNYSGS